jgi:hypothetical protein
MRTAQQSTPQHNTALPLTAVTAAILLYCTAASPYITWAYIIHTYCTSVFCRKYHTLSQHHHRPIPSPSTSSTHSSTIPTFVCFHFQSNQYTHASTHSHRLHSIDHTVYNSTFRRPTLEFSHTPHSSSIRQLGFSPRQVRIPLHQSEASLHPQTAGPLSLHLDNLLHHTYSSPMDKKDSDNRPSSIWTRRST